MSWRLSLWQPRSASGWGLGRTAPSYGSVVPASLPSSVTAREDLARLCLSTAAPATLFVAGMEVGIKTASSEIDFL